MIKNRNVDPGAFIDPSKVAGFGVWGMGEVFYVVRAADTAIKNWLLQRVPRDHVFLAATSGADVAINAALAACVECRNDYVVLMPSNTDYDLTAQIAISKKCVHLVCPAGLGYDRGSTSACRVHQNTAATHILAVSDAAIEVAGFYLKPYTGQSHLTIAATSYGLNIHHNFFTLQTTTSNDSVIACSGDGGAWGYVSHHNFFESMGGDDQTTATMISIDASATGARVDYNDFFIGDGNTYTIVVSNAATKGSVNFNNFMIAGSDGTATHCVAIGSYGSAIGNRACVGDGAIITGGVNDVTNVDNMNAVNGGAVDDLD